MKSFITALFFLPVSVFAQPAYDTTLTESARLMAGLDCEREDWKKIQQKAFYKEHVDFTSRSWKELQDSTLNPMINWAREKSIIEDRDTGTCFYPFSGPDFLFADQFFPKCKDYILLGLERLGTFPDFKKLNDQQLTDYLSSVRSAQRYLLKAGYFVTAHMSQDFSKSVLNGNIHLVMYFLVRTGHKIVALDYGGVMKDGKFLVSSFKTAQKIPGFRIQFFRDGETQLKSLYYFSLDVADYKLSTKPEFKNFIVSFPLINTYIKSASYIPAHKNFATVRNIIIDHSLKILQDDTGVPIGDLDKTKFEIQLWGTYTKTIKDLSWGYDPELRKALEASGNNKPLPFKISYNGNYGEGMMLYAKRVFSN